MSTSLLIQFRLNQVVVSFINFWVSSTTLLISLFIIKITCSKFCLNMFSYWGAEKTPSLYDWGSFFAVYVLHIAGRPYV